MSNNSDSDGSSKIVKISPPSHNLSLPNYNGRPLNYIYQLSATPYPAVLQSGLLLATPYLSPQVPFQLLASNKTLAEKARTIETTSWFSSSLQKGLGSFARTRGIEKVGISSRSALLFGIASLGGSWMIFDNDLESGCGFTAAWSSLYLIINGKSSLTWIKFGKVWPMLISGLALENTAMYGRRYLTGGFN